MKNIDIDTYQQTMPTSFSVAVIMQQTPSANPWCDYNWQAIGIAVLDEQHTEVEKITLIHEANDTRQYRVTGLEVRLYQDECESYYHNIISDQPACYIVAQQPDQGMPEPLLVTMSYDEAHAYLEGDDEVYVVSMPAELYRWLEAFVLAYYAPQKRTRRKRQDWKQDSQRGTGHGI